MPKSLTNVAVARAAQRLPVLKRLPLARLVLLGELAILAKTHFERLSPAERRRLVALVREAKGRPRNLPDRQRRELTKLVAKIEPKLFASEAFRKL